MKEGDAMSGFYVPIRVDVDNGDTDESYFSLGFVFGHTAAVVPHNIGLCRDELEGDPGSIYIEADDQVHGFTTKAAKYSIDAGVLTITLLDENFFYWDESKVVNIKISSEDAGAIEGCMSNIFSI